LSNYAAKSLLEPTERIGEVLFGLIMVLTLMPSAQTIHKTSRKQ
jgi:hypothetical protein